MKSISTQLILGSGTFIALLGAAFAQDNAFRLHMSVLVIVLGIATIYVLCQIKFTPQEAPDTSSYMDGPIRVGSIMTMIWGITGFSVEVIIASQLAWPELNWGLFAGHYPEPRICRAGIVS